MSGANNQPTNEDMAAEIKVLDHVTGQDIERSPEENEERVSALTDEDTADDAADDVADGIGTRGDSGDDDGDDVGADDDPADDDADDADVEVDDDEDEGLGLDELLAGGEDDDEDDDDDGDPKPKNRNKVPARKRIAELTARRHEAEEAAAAEKARADELQRKLDAVTNGEQLTETNAGDKTDDKAGSGAESDIDKDAPKPEDFKYGELDPDYAKAVARHEAEKVIAEARAEDDKKRQSEAEQQRAAEIQTKYESKIEAGVAAYPDFQQVVVERAERGEYPLTPQTALMALDSPVGEKVIYDIASNLKLAKELAGMSEIEQARAFGRLEARHTATADSKPKKRKASKAPAPPKKRGRGTASRSSLDPKTASITDLEKKWNTDGRI